MLFNCEWTVYIKWNSGHGKNLGNVEAIKTHQRWWVEIHKKYDCEKFSQHVNVYVALECFRMSEKYF